MDGNMKMQRSSYGRFGAMIVTSTIVMFVLMYLNSYALDHVFYSQTRTWMAVYMGAAMAIVMLGFMWSMYKDRRKNAAIISSSILVFAVSLLLVLSQQPFDAVSYMKAIIPHHSITLLNIDSANTHHPTLLN